MEFNLKLLIGIMTLLLGNGFVYSTEKKENSGNASLKRYFEEKSKEFVLANPTMGGFIPGAIQASKPRWYAEWKMENTNNPEEYIFMALASDYRKNIDKHELDVAIEKLKNEKPDINNVLYWVTKQTLLMKILETISDIDHVISMEQKRLQGISSLDDPANYYGGMKIDIQNDISEKGKQIKKLKDFLKELLPYVNDFDIKDKSGKTVFDYSEDKEMIELLNRALEERKKKIREHLDEGLPVKDLQNIVLGY